MAQPNTDQNLIDCENLFAGALEDYQAHISTLIRRYREARASIHKFTFFEQ